MAKPTGFGGRDYPDFGVSALNASSMIITDLSELAVRQGSINRFDRTGTVLFQEAFDYGRGNWFENSYPAGAFATLNGEYFSTRPYSLRLQSTTDVGSYCGVSCCLPFPFMAPMGIEVHFKGYTQFKQLIMQFILHDGTSQHRIDCAINGDDDNIKVYKWPGGYTSVSEDDLYFGVGSPFHVLKIVADPLTGYYHRLMIDEMDYSIPTFAIRKTSPSSRPQLYGLIMLIPTSGDVETVFIDNIIITINEPI